MISYQSLLLSTIVLNDDSQNNHVALIPYFCIPYNGLFSQGANFHECCTFGLSRNFHNSEIHDPLKIYSAFACY